MARYDNYRFQNLVRLLDILDDKRPSLADIRLIDQSCSTTYFTDLVHAHDWPPYIGWFGLTDTISDIVADHVFENLAEDEVEKLRDTHRKLSAEDAIIFTPTIDQVLRDEFRLDEIERNWFGYRRTIQLENEFKRAGISGVNSARISETGRNFLSYALHASRRNHWNLAAYCISEFILTELTTKFILMKNKAEMNGIRYGDLLCDPIPSNFLELIKLADPQSNPINFDKFVLWSHGENFFDFDENILVSTIDFISRVNARVWPSPDHTRYFAEMILNQFGEGTLLKFFTLTSPIQDRSFGS